MQGPVRVLQEATIRVPGALESSGDSGFAGTKTEIYPLNLLLSALDRIDDGASGMKGDVFLVHWREMEAAALAREIGSFEWHVDFESSDGAKAGRLIKEHRPNAVVIYLSRLPSHGRETAKSLRETRGIKKVPIVFVDGNDEVVQRTRAQVPDAIYTTSEELERVLDRYKDV